MASEIVLTCCRVQFWRNDPFQCYAEIEDIEMQFDSGCNKILLKEHLDKYSSDTCAVFDLRACTYLASNTLPDNSHIIYLRLNNPVEYIAMVDESLSSESRALETSAVGLFCTMGTLKLEGGWKMDITIPPVRNDQHSIPEVIQAFKGHAGHGFKNTNSVQRCLIDDEVTSPMASITLSDTDLDYLETFDGPPANSLLAPGATADSFRLRKTSAYNKHARHRQQQNLGTSFSPRKDSAIPQDREQERAKKEKWTANQEMWKNLSPENGHKPRHGCLEKYQYTVRGGSRPANGWTDFAESHGASKVKIEGHQVPDSKDTGGYLQDPNRDYNRPDGVRQSPLQTSRPMRVRRRPRARKSATFNPPTNSSHARASPEWRV